jgi:hypothetical protein
MEHTEAVETLACERYLLHELTPEDRDAFEEHYFGCAECAADVKAEAAIVSGVRAGKVRRQPRPWATWSSVAAAAVLAVIVGYQNFTPAFQQARVLHPPSQALSTSSVRSAQGEQTIASLYGDVVTVDVDAVEGASGYTLEVVDSGGSSRASQHIAAADAAKTVYLVPAHKLPPGSYSLKVKPEGAGQPSSVPFVVR